MMSRMCEDVYLDAPLLTLRAAIAAFRMTFARDHLQVSQMGAGGDLL